MSGGTIVIAAGVLRRASAGGHVSVFSQYVRGLRRLGYRTLFVDALVGSEQLPRPGNRAFDQALELLGGIDSLVVLDASGHSILGISRDEAERVCRNAEALLNVMGYLTDPDLLAGPERRVFVDIDPGFGQMWHSLGLANVLSGHDSFVTVGTRVGQPESSVPTCGVNWIPMLPPVVLDDWPAQAGRRTAPVTSVISWRGPFGPIEYDGRTYGLRAHEFRRFFDLPKRTGSPFQLALAIDPADQKDLSALHNNGWDVVSPEVVAADTERYRQFIESSKAELMIAKNMYIATQGGWFSDRSACYLATGRPVAAQDTGWPRAIPAGDGLLAFKDVESAIEALADIDSRYQDHCEAARALAEEHFQSDVVLSSMLMSVGIA